MRYLLAALVLVTGCYGESVRPPREPRERPGPEGTDLAVDPEIHKLGATSVPSTFRTRPAAKTIEWAPISTEEGAAYAGGAVVVDRIFRDDADDLYGVRVRLKNKADKDLNLEYLIRFYSRSGVQLAASEGGVGASERWKPFTIESYKTAVVHDSARIGGADGFRLHIRTAGAAGDGSSEGKK